MLLAGIAAIAGLRVTVQPDLSVFEVGSDELSIDAIADAMNEAGWYPDRQPGGMHFMLSPYHSKITDQLLAALSDSVAQVRAGRKSNAGAATYGATLDQTGDTV